MTAQVSAAARSAPILGSAIEGFSQAMRPPLTKELSASRGASLYAPRSGRIRARREGDPSNRRKFFRGEHEMVSADAVVYKGPLSSPPFQIWAPWYFKRGWYSLLTIPLFLVLFWCTVMKSHRGAHSRSLRW